jgi:acyl-CoA dehydrogenase
MNARERSATPPDDATLAELLAALRRFVRERLLPLEAQVADEDAVPTEVVGEMAAMGLFGLSIPEKFGGLGLSMLAEAKAVQELGYASPAFRSTIGTNVGIGSQGIVIDGTEEQKHAYLPPLASGALVSAFALTEPEAGSDAASLRTRAVRHGERYVVSGTKRFITNADRADLFTVLVRTGRPEDRAAGITALLIDARLPGIKVGSRYRKMGQAGSAVCDVTFDEVAVPVSAIVGGPEREGLGFRTAMKVLDRARLHLAALSVGAAQRLIDESLCYALDRKQFGSPIAEFQLVQAMLADSRAEHFAGRSMVEAAARRLDAGEPVSTEASCCKLFCTEMVGRVADRAVQILGGAGYMAGHPVERFYRDVRLFRLYEGTSQIQQLVIARNMIREHRGESPERGRRTAVIPSEAAREAGA